MQTMAVSNGVTVDLTPPIAGTVLDGGNSFDTFQASTQTLSPAWAGFVDLESGIDVRCGPALCFICCLLPYTCMCL